MDSQGTERRVQKFGRRRHTDFWPVKLPTKQTMKKILPTAAVILFTVVITAISEELPKAWLHAGNRPADYEISVDRKVSHDGKASASLKSIADKTEGFGTLMQTFKADAYRGRRIKMTAFVKSENVSGWAGLWMRVDGPMLAEAKMPEPLDRKST